MLRPNQSAGERRLVEANPLVEEAKNQIAVVRGPIVYCLEGQDIEDGHRINDIAIPADIQFTEKTWSPLLTSCSLPLAPCPSPLSDMVVLEGEALLVNNDSWSNDQLYRDLRPVEKKKVKIRLIPYYAWDNRGIDDMSLWLPLAR